MKREWLIAITAVSVLALTAYAAYHFGKCSSSRLAASQHFSRDDKAPDNIFACEQLLARELALEEKDGKRGGEAPPPPGMQQPPPRLSSEDEEKVEKFVKEIDPWQYKDLQEVKSRDEFLYHRMVCEFFGHMKFLERIKKEKPEVYKNIVEEKRLEGSNRETLERIKNEKDRTKVKKLRDELREKLSKIFDLRQLAKEEMIKDLEKNLGDLKEKNEVRKKNKEKIVEYRVVEMVGKVEGMEW